MSKLLQKHVIVLAFICLQNVVVASNYWKGCLYNDETGETKWYTADEIYTSNGAMISDYDPSNCSLHTEFYFKDTACLSKDFSVTFEFQYLGHCSGNYVTCGMSNMDYASDPVFSESTKKSESVNLRKSGDIDYMTFTRKANMVKCYKNNILSQKWEVDFCAFYNFYCKSTEGGVRLLSFQYIDNEHGTKYYEDFSNIHKNASLERCEPPYADIKANLVHFPNETEPYLELSAQSSTLTDFNWVDPLGNSLGSGQTIRVDDGLNAVSGMYRVWGGVSPCIEHYEIDSVWVNVLDPSDTIAIEPVDPIVPDTAIVWPPIHPAEFLTPNGDGIHDTWEIEGLDYYCQYVIWIYDRNGRLIFQSENKFEGWNGMSNGQPMNSSDYWYVIELREADRLISGHFTLIR